MYGNENFPQVWYVVLLRSSMFIRALFVMEKTGNINFFKKEIFKFPFVSFPH